MTPKQHFRRLQLKLEIAEFGMGMPLDRERVKELREQVEQARKDATNDNAAVTGYDILSDEHMDSDGFDEEQGGY